MSATDVSPVTFPVQPPWSDDAESALLGHVIAEPEKLQHVPAELHASHFYSEANRRIFEAVRAIAERDELPTLGAVDAELKKHDRKRQVGGRISDALREATGSGTPAQLQAHASLIIELAARRVVLDATRRVVGELELGRTTSTEAADRLRSIAKGTPSKAPPENPFRTLMRPIGELWSEALSTPPPEPKWLLRRGSQETAPGVLRAGKVGFLIAAGGVGKTQALVQLAIAVATGGWWLGAFHVREPGRVLLALAEEDADEVRRRLYHAAILAGLNASGQRDVLARIVAMPLAGTPVSLVAPGVDGEVRETATFDALHSALLEQTWSLVALDPLSRWAGHDTEKDNAAATRFLQALERLTIVPGSPAVLIAHHTPKASRGGNGAVASARGVSGLTDGARWAATVEEVDRDEVADLPFEVVEFAIVKSNYARKGEPISVVRDAKHLGALRAMRPDERAQYEQAIEVREKRKGPPSTPPPASMRATNYEG